MSDGQRLAIAIALSALKFKPPERPASLYVIDLWKSFPTTRDFREQQIAERERVAELERRLKELQHKYDTDRIELLSLRAACEPKKKAKKKAAAPQSRGRIDFDLTAVLDGRSQSIDLLVMPENSAFSAFNSLQQLVEMPESSKLPSVLLLVRTIRRAVDALNAILRRTLPPNPPLGGCPEVLKTVSLLTNYLLMTAVPVLAAKTQARKKPALATSTAISDVFGLVASGVFCPVVASFTPASLTWINRLYSYGREEQARVTDNDIRPHLMHLVQSGILTLDAYGDNIAQRCARDLKERLVLEAIRELDLCFSDPAEVGQESEVERQRRTLARKDAFWYLLNVIHTAISPKAESRLPSFPDLGEGVTTSRQLLREAILISFSGLLAKVTGAARAVDCLQPNGRVDRESSGRKAVINKVEEGMILAAAEEYWASCIA